MGFFFITQAEVQYLILPLDKLLCLNLSLRITDALTFCVLVVSPCWPEAVLGALTPHGWLLGTNLTTPSLCFTYLILRPLAWSPVTALLGFGFTISYLLSLLWLFTLLSQRFASAAWFRYCQLCLGVSSLDCEEFGRPALLTQLFLMISVIQTSGPQPWEAEAADEVMVYSFETLRPFGM